MNIQWKYAYIEVAVCMCSVLFLFPAVHVHKKFLSRKGVKFRTPDEEHQWAKAVKAMNAHIRYRRSKLVAASKKKDTQ